LICGAINGGPGLKLAVNSKGGEIAWSIVAGITALGYTAILLIKRKSGKSMIGRGAKKELTS
jgi:hypothetical protein